MAAFTSKAAGNWSASGQTTWNEVGVPGNGDTATVSHTVTVDTDTTVGTSGASGTTAVTVTAAGQVVVADGVRLTVRGDVLCATSGTVKASVLLQAGGKFRFDASQATTPLSQKYTVRLGGANADKCRFEAQGTSAKRCTVDSDAGGGNGYFSRSTFTNTEFFICSYTDFTRIGDSSNRFCNSDLATSSSNSKHDFANCTFDACGTVDATNGGTPGSASFMSYVNCSWKNTAGSGLTVSTATSPSGTRVIKGCVFDKAVTINQCSNWTLGGASLGEENYFAAGLTLAGSTAWAGFQNAVVRRGSSAQETVSGNATDVLYLQDHTTTNPHFVGINTSLPTGTYTFDGCLFWYQGSATNGDGINTHSPSNTHVVEAIRCLVLPNAGAGLASCSLLSALGNANVSFRVRHCTMMGGGNSSAGVTLGETYAGYAGMMTGFQSNIVWKPSGTTGYKLHRDVAGSVADICSPSNADYNCGWNLGTGSDLKGYNAASGTMFSSAPGAHDVDGDPQFVDHTRSIATWDSSLGGPGTVANALAELAKKNDAAGYNTSYNIPALLTYLRGGFAPTAVALQGAGHDGVDIGAVAVVAGQPVTKRTAGVPGVNGTPFIFGGPSRW